MESARIMVNERVKRLEQKMFVPPSLCTERGSLMTESYKETEGEPFVLRKAKALAKMLREMTVHIEEGELIVGKATSKMRGGAILPEISAQWLLEELDTLSTREWDRFAPVAEDEKAKVREFLPYWKGRSLSDLEQSRVPANIRDLETKGIVAGGSCGAAAM